MQSKTLVWAYLLILSLGTILSLYMPKNAAVAKESVVIPGDAIRLRILANSDLDSDQALKRDVRDAVNAKITVWVKDLTTLQKAKQVIQSKLPELQATAEQVVHEHGSNQSVKVQFGKVQFPTKLYGEFLYPAGEYQAVLITLGKGEGANWWCVLYPPLCFLDFSNGVAVSAGFEDNTAKAATVSDAKTSAEQDQPAKDASSASQTSSADSGQDPETEGSQTSSADAGQNSETDAGQTSAAETSQTPTADIGQTSLSNSNQTLAADAGKSVSDSISSSDVPSSSEENQGPQMQDGSGDQKTGSVQQDRQAAPVYTPEDEQPVKVKFFIVELFQKLFE